MGLIGISSNNTRYNPEVRLSDAFIGLPAGMHLSIEEAFKERCFNARMVN
jgi:hypothetical protein